jgi:hypothetical protein
MRDVLGVVAVNERANRAEIGGNDRSVRKRRPQHLRSPVFSATDV